MAALISFTEPRVKGSGNKEFVKGRDEALRLDEMGIEAPIQSVSTRPRSQSLSEGLQGVKETLSRSSVIKTRPSSKSVSSSREL